MISRATKSHHAGRPQPDLYTREAAAETPDSRGALLEGQGPEELKDVDIVITDNRITSVKPHSATPLIGITRTIEAGDSTVMPGLWESHAHNDSDNSIYYGDRMGRFG